MTPTSRAVATTEAPSAPVLLSLYVDHGLVGRVELAPVAALALAADLLIHATAKTEDE